MPRRHVSIAGLHGGGLFLSDPVTLFTCRGHRSPPRQEGVIIMASVRKEIETNARPKDAWAAIARYRCPPYAAGARICDRDASRAGRTDRDISAMASKSASRSSTWTTRQEAVWSAEGAGTTHYNASVQVFEGTGRGSRVVWIADFLPHDQKSQFEAMMEQGVAVMKRTLDSMHDQ